MLDESPPEIQFLSSEPSVHTPTFLLLVSGSRAKGPVVQAGGKGTAPLLFLEAVSTGGITRR